MKQPSRVEERNTGARGLANKFNIITLSTVRKIGRQMVAHPLGEPLDEPSLLLTDSMLYLGANSQAASEPTQQDLITLLPAAAVQPQPAR